MNDSHWRWRINTTLCVCLPECVCVIIQALPDDTWGVGGTEGRGRKHTFPHHIYIPDLVTEACVMYANCHKRLNFYLPEDPQRCRPLQEGPLSQSKNDKVP